MDGIEATRRANWKRTHLVAAALLTIGCGADPLTKLQSGNDAGQGDGGRRDGGADGGSIDASTDSGSIDGGTDGGPDAGGDSGVIPEIIPGPPIVATNGQWVKVPIPEGQCRHGGDAYMMVHLNSASKKVAIYEEGGGACFSDASCSFLNFNAPSYALGAGIFNFTNAENPIRDWNVFYIPYCTGDVQAGDNPSSYVGPITGTTSFNGWRNMKAYIARILGTVPDATDYFLTGSSAGGFGAGLVADLVARNAPATVQRFTLVDDSGPPMGTAQIPSCLLDTWRTVWGFDRTFLAQCGAACPKPDDYINDWVNYLVQKYAVGPNAPKFMGGLVSSTGDAIISTFYGFGANDCKPLFGIPNPLSEAEYTAGLLGFRSLVQPQTDRFGTFFYKSKQHTTLMLNKGDGILGGLYDTQVGTVRLVDWLRDLLDHTQAPHVGP